MFLKANSSLVGPSEGIAVRFPDRRSDHEVEFVMVIGKTGSDIPRALALDYVACYCLGLDMTVRGREDRSFRKSVDGYAVAGPGMVTTEKIANPDAADARSQRRTTSGQQYQYADLRSPAFDRIRFVILYALSRRPDLHRNTGGRGS